MLFKSDAPPFPRLQHLEHLPISRLLPFSLFAKLQAFVSLLCCVAAQRDLRTITLVVAFDVFLICVQELCTEVEEVGAGCLRII